MSDCCLMPNQQCFSHVMARTSYRGTFNEMMDDDDDKVRFGLDQHAELDFNSTSSLKQQSRVDMSIHSDTLF